MSAKVAGGAMFVIATIWIVNTSYILCTWLAMADELDVRSPLSHGVYPSS